MTRRAWLPGLAAAIIWAAPALAETAPNDVVFADGAVEASLTGESEAVLKDVATRADAASIADQQNTINRLESKIIDKVAKSFEDKRVRCHKYPKKTEP